MTRRLNVADCDQRRRAGLLICDNVYPDPERRSHRLQYPSLGIVAGRTIVEEDDAVAIDISLLRTDHSGKRPDLVDCLGAAWWIWVLAGTDVERVRRRGKEADGAGRIDIRILDVANTEATRTIAEELSARLHRLVEREMLDTQVRKDI